MGLVIIFSQCTISRDTHTVEERSIANEDLMEYVRLLMKDIIENKNYKHYKQYVKRQKLMSLSRST